MESAVLGMGKIRLDFGKDFDCQGSWMGLY